VKNSKLYIHGFAAVALSIASLSTGITSTPAFAANQALEASETQTNNIASGTWTKKSFKSSGSWSVYEEGGQTYIKLSDDFKTRNAPDLKIFLSPLSVGELNGKNATEGSLLISALSSNKGGQIYEVPAGLDISNYASIIIHCEAYSKLWSAASL